MNIATRWDQYFDVPNDSLRAYFGSVVKGKSKILYGGFMNVDTPEKVSSVLEDWYHHLQSLKTEWPTLYDYETEMKSKVGPMSVMKPLKERRADIKAYYEDIKSKGIYISVDAVNAFMQEFMAVKGLRLRSQKHTVEEMRKSTNSGSPYFNKHRRDVLQDTIPVTSLNRKSYFYKLGRLQTHWWYCAILGWRGQEGGPEWDDVKQRVVWMFPFAINILELQVYQPFILACQRNNLVAPWISMDSVDERITQLFDTKGEDDLIICTDFTKFDQHFNKYLQECARLIWTKILMPCEDSYKWIQNVFPIKYEIPLAVNWNEILFGKHGMGSGSGGTNADETVVHRTMQHEAALTDHAELNLNSMCLGDDGILSYPGCTVESVMATYMAHGLELNASKQYASTTDCVFLRRWHHKDYRINGRCAGVYSTCRALGRLMYKERYHKEWSYIDETLRSLSILENCKYHPLRDEFAKYVMDRDKYHLGKDIPGFLESIDEISKQRANTIRDELSYTNTMNETKLSSWWIVQYVLHH